jgi:segregation and condensation protein B
MVSLARVVEALLFASDEPLSVPELLSIFERSAFEAFIVDAALIQGAISEIQAKYATEDCSFELRSVALGYQFFTKSIYADFIQAAFNHPERKKLSKAALETLAIIAYKQPITKAELEHIRGVSSDYSIQKLLEKSLITPAGRAEDLPGKPLRYATTTTFLTYFGLYQLSDLPKLTEITTDEETIQQDYKVFPIQPQ